MLHLAPHPDDEALGAPATLMGLRDAGWRVVNLACGLGSDPALRLRRRAEVEEACARAGFALRVADTDDVGAAVAEVCAAEPPRLVISPDPGELHPAHAAVGRAAEAAVAGASCSWWTWALWGELRRPTRIVEFGPERMREIEDVLAAHESQVARNDYATLLRARAELARVRGPELVHGFGSPGVSAPFAELLSERR